MIADLQRACDAHIHVFDPRFRETLAADDMSTIPATVDDYLRVQPHFGTSRVVIVTPRNYDVDNAVTLDAIRQFGQDRARGIATVRPDITDAQLDALHAGGVRGLRFTLYTPDHAPTRFDMIEPLAHRIRRLGWHLQLHWTAGQIVEHRELIERLPVQCVFDHFARLPQPDAFRHPARPLVAKWLREGRVWLKLSAPYLDSRSNTVSGYADMDSLARYWIDVAPDRLVWGSDWPHTSWRPAAGPQQISATQSAWFPSLRTRQQVLIDNPATLYEF